MFSTYFIFRQKENLVEDQKSQAGFRPLCNKILLFNAFGIIFSQGLRIPNETVKLENKQLLSLLQMEEEKYGGDDPDEVSLFFLFSSNKIFNE